MFLKPFSRQLLAPGYQEIWYSPDGSRRSSSPTNSVSLNKQIYLFLLRGFEKDCSKGKEFKSVTTLTKNAAAFSCSMRCFMVFSVQTRLSAKMDVELGFCLPGSLFLPWGGSGCGGFQRGGQHLLRTQVNKQVFTKLKI